MRLGREYCLERDYSCPHVPLVLVEFLQIRRPEVLFDLLFLLLGLLAGFLAGLVFGRFVPSPTLASLIDLTVAALASVLAIIVCAWLSRQSRLSLIN